MSVIKVNNITNRDGTSGPVIAGITTVSSTSHMVVPTGSTGQRVALAPDPYINNLVLALPFNSESVFSDLSVKKHGDPSLPVGFGTTVSSLPFGQGGITTTSPGITTFSKYYNNSVYFDGKRGPILYGDTGTDLNFGNEEFTVELWVYPKSINTSFLLWNGNDVGINSTSTLYLSISSSKWVFAVSGQPSYPASFLEGAQTISSSNAVAETWTHLAFTKNNTTSKIEMWVNGSQVGVTTFGNDFKTNNVFNGLKIGDYVAPGNVGTAYTGYIQDFRIYRGVAKYTSNFTPPNQIAL